MENNNNGTSAVNVDRSTLKSWFVKFAKPTQAQFAAWIDAFWHKSERFPMAQVADLAETLAVKADAEALQFFALKDASNLDETTLEQWKSALEVEIPENIATIDLNELVGNVYTKEQTDELVKNGKVNYPTSEQPTGGYFQIENEIKLPVYVKAFHGVIDYDGLNDPSMGYLNFNVSDLSIERIVEESFFVFDEDDGVRKLKNSSFGDMYIENGIFYSKANLITLIIDQINNFGLIETLFYISESDYQGGHFAQHQHNINQPVYGFIKYTKLSDIPL
jgi:hypothetical protein